MATENSKNRIRRNAQALTPLIDVVVLCADLLSRQRSEFEDEERRLDIVCLRRPAPVARMTQQTA